MLKSIVLIPAVLAASAFAQSVSVTVSVSTSISQSMPASATQGFDQAQVNSTTRQTWCSNQVAQCVNICGGRYSENMCDAPTLTYACVCLNGTEPDLSAYLNTIPFFECQATYSQCIENNQNNLTGQMECTNNQKCGSKVASPPGATTTMSTSTASGTASGTGSASASASAASSSSSHAGAIAVTPISNGVFAALLLALWRVAL